VRDRAWVLRPPASLWQPRESAALAGSMVRLESSCHSEPMLPNLSPHYQSRTWILLMGLELVVGCSGNSPSPSHTAAGGVTGPGGLGGSNGGSSVQFSNAGAPSTSTGNLAGSGQVLVHVDFQGRTTGAYSQTMASEDFAGKATWNNGMDQGRSTIVDEAGQRFLRVTYAAGVYGPDAGGVQFLIPLSSSFDELYLSYRVRFASDFDFVRGGKLPGLVGGTHPTGCVTDTAGFSARMMWRPAGACVQYLYFPEKVNSCGDDFPYRVGTTAVNFVPGQWHRVQHRVRMNTPGAHDGVLQGWFDGTLGVDNQAFIYRIATESFGIDALYFSTFFGGSDATWAPAVAQIADFDDIVVSDRPIE